MFACVPPVTPPVMEAIVQVESSGNPYAIGVVGGRLVRQPKNQAEAAATAWALHRAGWNFSLGLAQINRYNLEQHGLTYESVFDRCANLRAGARILSRCHDEATRKYGEKEALPRALSCYYSGNFTRGLRPDKSGEMSYVAKVLSLMTTATTARNVWRQGKGGEARRVTTARAKSGAVIWDAQPMMYRTSF